MMVMTTKVTMKMTIAMAMTTRCVHKESKQNRWRSTKVPRTETKKRPGVTFQLGRRGTEQQEEAFGGWTRLESRNEYPYSSRSCTDQLVALFRVVELAEGQEVGLITCEGVGGVQGALALFCGGVAQTCHDDGVVELKEQLVVEEVDGERQEGKVKEEGRDRVKENAPWMTWR